MPKTRYIILIAVLALMAVYILSQRVIEKSESTEVNSIIVENIVNFDRYDGGNDKSPQDTVEFILKVTNLGEDPIPDLGVANRSKYVNFYINDKIDNPISLYNGTEPQEGYKLILKNKSATFATGWVIPNSGLINTYGDEFTVQWQYLDRLSIKAKVNLKDKTSVVIEDE